MSHSTSYNLWMCMCMCVFLFSISLKSIVNARSIIDSLPGFNGKLPFKLETGYVGVDKTEGVHLFYYFIESQRSPSRDPLVLWHGAGPGCSGLSVLFYESGPLAFDYTDIGKNGSLPTIILNPYTWTKGLNMLYLDSPIGAGFSYSTSTEGYNSDDSKSAAQIYTFLQKWLIDHPEFMGNRLYIGGDSYSGILLPIVIQKVLDGNEVGSKPYMNIKGYALGSPKTDSYLDANSKVHLAHRLALIPDELYESAKTSCNGDYVNFNSSNIQCVAEINVINELLNGINVLQVMEPLCTSGSPAMNTINQDRRSLTENSKNLLHSQPKSTALWCRDYYYVLSEIWANNQSVREALHIKEGTKGNYQSCNSSLSHTQNVLSTIDYHRNFSKTGLRALIYVSDLDLSIPYISTHTWIKSLNLTVDEYWRAWFVDGQIAGYTERYMNDNYHLTYITVKGGGHVPALYKQKECYTIIDRWLAYYPI